VTASGQHFQQDAAYRIQKLAGHEHQHNGHQSFGHVVLRLSLLGHLLTTLVELTKGDDQAVGHAGRWKDQNMDKIRVVIKSTTMFEERRQGKDQRMMQLSATYRKIRH